MVRRSHFNIFTVHEVHAVHEVHLRHQAFVALVALLLALLLAACNPEGETEKVEFRVPVTVREVEVGTVEDLVVATGT